LAELDGAEVFSLLTHDKDASVPEGQIKALLRYKKLGETRLTQQWFGPSPVADYQALNPTRTEEKRSFKDSTVENLQELVSRFRNLGGLIGRSSSLELPLKQMEALLNQFGGKPAELAQELRDSRTF